MGHCSNSILALTSLGVMVVSRMAISEQKKVALCDRTARLPLNLFISTHPPYFQLHINLQLMEVKIALCRHYWVSIWCQFLAFFLLRILWSHCFVQKYLHSRIAKITAYSTNRSVFSVILESLQAWQCMDMHAKVFCSYILLLLVLVSLKSWKAFVFSKTEAYSKAKSLPCCLYVTSTFLPHRN